MRVWLADMYEGEGEGLINFQALADAWLEVWAYIV